MAKAVDRNFRKKSSLSVEDLLKIWSHDIMNDVSVISCQTQSIKESGNDIEENMEAIRESAEHIIKINSEFKHVVESNTEDLRPIPADKKIGECIDSFETRYPNVDISIDFIPSCDVIADSLLSSIIDNILKNAAQHGGQHVKITISGNETPDFVELCFSDNGRGMDEQVVDKIHKASAVELLSYDSIGVGMFIIKTGLDRYGGDIDISIDNGTDFKIKLPKKMNLEHKPREEGCEETPQGYSNGNDLEFCRGLMNDVSKEVTVDLDDIVI